MSSKKCKTNLKLWLQQLTPNKIYKGWLKSGASLWKSNLLMDKMIHKKFSFMKTTTITLKRSNSSWWLWRIGSMGLSMIMMKVPRCVHRFKELKVSIKVSKKRLNPHLEKRKVVFQSYLCKCLTPNLFQKEMC